MKLIDSICAPGSALKGGLKRGAGDDRFAFDEAAGWAAVVDGATDVGPVRLYSDAESDAAHYAELFARALVAHPALAGETPQDYFARFVPELRDAAARDMRVPLKDAPAASLPTAAAAWVRARGGRLEGATLGDCIAILRTPSGAVSVLGDGGKPGDEQVRAKRVMAMTYEQRRQWLQDVRALHNTERGYWIFGVQPEAASRIVHQSVDAPPGSRALLMTDGFYRLVSPYGLYDEARLIEAASAKGLGALLSEIRAMESDAADDAKIGRFKTSDDATALLIEV
jgi:hypothetical protein